MCNWGVVFVDGLCNTLNIAEILLTAKVIIVASSGGRLVENPPTRVHEVKGYQAALVSKSPGMQLNDPSGEGPRFKLSNQNPTAPPKGA